MDNLRNSYKKIIEHRKEAYDSGVKESSKQRLRNIVEKKLMTTCIGSVAILEKTLGELWGHGLEESQCTENQKKWRQKWNFIRNEILNNGNKQLRSFFNEIKYYDIVWNRYQSRLTKNQEESSNG